GGVRCAAGGARDRGTVEPAEGAAVMKAVLDLIGGVRAAVFLGLFLATLVALGVQSHRLDTRTEERDTLKAEALVWASAQRTNMETLATQARALEQWRGIAGEREAEAQAAAREAASLQ